MKIIVTTSDAYLHIMPVFSYLFNKYWGGTVEVVGYKKPLLPDNFSFVSLGVQGSKNEFSTDLRKYFEKQDNWFIWLMEDTFIKGVDHHKLNILQSLCKSNTDVGRINLSGECIKQDHIFYDIIKGCNIYQNTPNADYRLSTQPSIWRKQFLLKYMTDGLSPWEFETQQAINDGYAILGPAEAAIQHNEGVRRFDLHKYNLEGLEAEDIEYIKTLR